MSTHSRLFDDDVQAQLEADEPTASEALELWAYLENPREMLEAGRRERGGEQ